MAEANASLVDVARSWLRAEPDEDIRSELLRLIAGDEQELRSAFAGTLTFGTAGLRARIGAGPLRMNRIVVRQAAAGFVDHLVTVDSRAAQRGILIGFDARHKSRVFAEDTARVAASRGVRALLFEDVVPTPVLAWSVPRHDVAGAVMVTASHNPPGDNGYKVYRENGAQIVSPIDRHIEEKIRAVDPLSIELAPADSPLITRVGRDAEEDYVRWVPSVRLESARGEIDIAYTALHGVGGRIAMRAMTASGFPPAHIVATQHEPDPEFPSVAFPNPEESGAMDLVVELARQANCALALANDPDADRLGVAVPSADGTWRRLSGDEVGWLMADHILRRTSGSDRLVVTTLVSSSLLAKMARVHGVVYEETFTGFKWIASAVEKHPECRLVFAYEQALGYLVAQEPLDKDGIAAAVLMSEIANSAARRGRSIDDLLDDIAEQFGRHKVAESSVRTSPDEGVQLVDALVRHPPSAIAARRVLDVIEFPEASLVRFLIEGSGTDPVRVQVRPSGTEPKVKVYAEAVDEDPRPYLDEVVALLGGSR